MGIGLLRQISIFPGASRLAGACVGIRKPVISDRFQPQKVLSSSEINGKAGC